MSSKNGIEAIHAMSEQFARDRAEAAERLRREQAEQRAKFIGDYVIGGPEGIIK